MTFFVPFMSPDKAKAAMAAERKACEDRRFAEARIIIANRIRKCVRKYVPWIAAVVGAALVFYFVR